MTNRAQLWLGRATPLVPAYRPIQLYLSRTLAKPQHYPRVLDLDSTLVVMVGLDL